MEIWMCSPVFVILLFTINTYGQITILCEHETRETIFSLSINASDIKCGQAGKKGIDILVVRKWLQNLSQPSKQFITCKRDLF
ncbi:MAG: hypothetical protein ACI959_000391 [Limisphaerales bacterium]|jgi:hypothetical protein